MPTACTHHWPSQRLRRAVTVDHPYRPRSLLPVAAMNTQASGWKFWQVSCLKLKRFSWVHLRDYAQAVSGFASGTGHR